MSLFALGVALAVFEGLGPGGCGVSDEASTVLVEPEARGFIVEVLLEGRLDPVGSPTLGWMEPDFTTVFLLDELCRSIALASTGWDIIQVFDRIGAAGISSIQHGDISVIFCIA
jgi:hypothetical protein